MALIHRNVKNTIIMFQCKTYLNTCLVWIIMLERLLVEVDIFSVFLYYELEIEKKNNIIWYWVPRFLFNEVLTQ